MIPKLQKTFSKLTSGETSKHLVKTYFVYGFIALSLIIIKILIARLYGQEELGVFTYFFSVVSLVFLFSSFGLSEAIAQLVIKDKEKLNSGIGWLIHYAVPFTIFFGLVTIVILRNTKFNPGIKWFDLAVIFYIVINLFSYTTTSILRGHKKFATASIYSLVQRALFIVFIVILYLLNWPFVYILFAMSLGLLITGLMAIPHIKKLNPMVQKTVNGKKFFYLALSLFMVQTSFYSLRFIDALMIQYLVNFKELGLYSAYSSITNGIRLVAYVFPAVIVPLASVSSYKLKQSFKKLLIYLTPFSLLVLIVTFFGVPFFYGADYNATYLPLALVVASSLLVVYAYFNAIFVGENKFSKFYIKIIGADLILSLGMNIGLNYWMIQKWGIIGAPIATAVTIIFKILVNLWGIKKLRKG